MNNNKNILGNRLEDLFGKYYITQNEVATRIGITPKHLNQIVSGKQLPSIETIYAISLLFNAYERVNWQELYHQTWNRKYLDKYPDPEKVLKDFGKEYLLSIGFLDENETQIETFSKMVSFYGSKCVYAYKDIVNKFLPFVDGEKITPETLIWFRQAELNRQNLTKLGIFRKSDFEKMVHFIFKIYSAKEIPSIEEIYQKIRTYFIKRGINVVSQKHIPGCQLRVVFTKRGTKKSIYVSDYDEGYVCNLFLTLEALYKIYYKDFDPKKVYDEFLSIYKKWSELKKREIANFESHVKARQESTKCDKCLCEWEYALKPISKYSR